jgi:hypothetical protein
MRSERKFGKLLERDHRGEDLHLSIWQERWYRRLIDLRKKYELPRSDLDEDARADYLHIIDNYVELPARETAGAHAGVVDGAKFYVGGLGYMGKLDYRKVRQRERIALPIINAIYKCAIDLTEATFPQWRGEIERPQGKILQGNFDDIRNYNWQYSAEAEHRIDIAFPDAERILRAAWEKAETREWQAAERRRRARPYDFPSW